MSSMDTDTRDRLDRLEAKIDALLKERGVPAPAGPAGLNSTLKSLIFWVVILVVLAAVWFFSRVQVT